MSRAGLPAGRDSTARLVLRHAAHRLLIRHRPASPSSGGLMTLSQSRIRASRIPQSRRSRRDGLPVRWALQPAPPASQLRFSLPNELPELCAIRFFARACHKFGEPRESCNCCGFGRCGGRRLAMCPRFSSEAAAAKARQQKPRSFHPNRGASSTGYSHREVRRRRRPRRMVVGAAWNCGA